MADVNNNKILYIVMTALFLFEPVVMNGGPCYEGKCHEGTCIETDKYNEWDYICSCKKGHTGLHCKNKMHRCELCIKEKIVECIGLSDKTAVCVCEKMQYPNKHGTKPQICYTAMPKPHRQKQCQSGPHDCDAGQQCVNYVQHEFKMLMLCQCPAGKLRGKECKEEYAVTESGQDACVDTGTDGPICLCSKYGFTFGFCKPTLESTSKVNQFGQGSATKGTTRYRADSEPVNNYNNQVNVAGSVSVGSNREYTNGQAYNGGQCDEGNNKCHEGTCIETEKYNEWDYICSCKKGHTGLLCKAEMHRCELCIKEKIVECIGLSDKTAVCVCERMQYPNKHGTKPQICYTAMPKPHRQKQCQRGPHDCDAGQQCVNYVQHEFKMLMLCQCPAGKLRGKECKEEYSVIESGQDACVDTGTDGPICLCSKYDFSLGFCKPNMKLTSEASQHGQRSATKGTSRSPIVPVNNNNDQVNVADPVLTSNYNNNNRINVADPVLIPNYNNQVNVADPVLTHNYNNNINNQVNTAESASVGSNWEHTNRPDYNGNSVIGDAQTNEQPIESNQILTPMERYRLSQQQQRNSNEHNVAPQNTITPLSYNRPSTTVAVLNSYNRNSEMNNAEAIEQPIESNHNLTPMERYRLSQQQQSNSNEHNAASQNTITPVSYHRPSPTVAASKSYNRNSVIGDAQTNDQPIESIHNLTPMERYRLSQQQQSNSNEHNVASQNTMTPVSYNRPRQTVTTSNSYNGHSVMGDVITSEKQTESNQNLSSMEEYGLSQQQNSYSNENNLASQNTRTPASYNRPRPNVAASNSYNGNASTILASHHSRRSVSYNQQRSYGSASNSLNRESCDEGNNKCHEGTCVETEKYKEVDYICSCKKGYTGLLCKAEMHRCELCIKEKIVECIGLSDKTAVCVCERMKYPNKHGTKPQICYTAMPKPHRQKQCQSGPHDCDAGQQCVNYVQHEFKMLMVCQCPAGKLRGKECKEEYAVIESGQDACVDTGTDGPICLCFKYGFSFGFCKPKLKSTSEAVQVSSATETTRNPVERYRAGSVSDHSNNNNEVNVVGSVLTHNNNNQVNVAGSASVGSNRGFSNRHASNGNSVMGDVETNEQQIEINQNLSPLEQIRQNQQQPSNLNEHNVASQNIRTPVSYNQPRPTIAASNSYNERDAIPKAWPNDNNERIEDNIPQDDRITNPFEPRAVDTYIPPADYVPVSNTDNVLVNDIENTIPSTAGIYSGPNPCNPNPCQNGGTCKVGSPNAGDYECDCRYDFRGKYCHEVTVKCELLGCDSTVDCVATILGGTCTCVIDNVGKICVTDTGMSAEEWDVVPKSERTGAEIVLGVIAAIIVCIIICICHCHRVNTRRSIMKKKYEKAKRKRQSPVEPPGWGAVSTHVLLHTFCCKSDSIVDNYLPKKEPKQKKSRQKKKDNPMETNADDSVSPNAIDVEISKRHQSRTGFGSNPNQSENNTWNWKTQHRHRSLPVDKMLRKYSSARPMSKYQRLYFDDEFHTFGDNINEVGRESFEVNNELEKGHWRRLPTKFVSNNANSHYVQDWSKTETRAALKKHVDGDDEIMDSKKKMEAIEHKMQRLRKSIATRQASIKQAHQQTKQIDTWRDQHIQKNNPREFIENLECINSAYNGNALFTTTDEYKATEDSISQNRNVNTNIEERLFNVQQILPSYFTDATECGCSDINYNLDNHPVYDYSTDHDRYSFTYRNLNEQTAAKPYDEYKPVFNTEQKTDYCQTDLHTRTEGPGRVVYSNQNEDNAREAGLNTVQNIDGDVCSCEIEGGHIYQDSDRELYGIWSTTIEIPVTRQENEHMNSIVNNKEALEKPEVLDHECKHETTQAKLPSYQLDDSTDPHYLKSFEKDGQKLYYVESDSHCTQFNFNQNHELVDNADSELYEHNGLGKKVEQNVDNEVFFVIHSSIETDSNSDCSGDCVDDDDSLSTCTLVASATDSENTTLVASTETEL